MNAETRRARKIILALSEKLSDELLGAWFPDTAPKQVRELLRRTADSCSLKSETRRTRAQAETPIKSGAREADTRARLGIEDEQCLLYTDGASRGNPGEAGAGFVVFDGKKNEILTGSTYLGKCTNNVAEYQALISGLESTAGLGCRKLQIFMDSELIVRQVQGTYKVKNAKLKPLFNRVCKLLKDD